MKEFLKKLREYDKVVLADNGLDLLIVIKDSNLKEKEIKEKLDVEDYALYRKQKTTYFNLINAAVKAIGITEIKANNFNKYKAIAKKLSNKFIIVGNGVKAIKTMKRQLNNEDIFITSNDGFVDYNDVLRKEIVAKSKELLLSDNLSDKLEFSLTYDNTTIDYRVIVDSKATIHKYM